MLSQVLAAVPAVSQSWSETANRLAVQGALGGALAEFLQASGGEQHALPVLQASVSLAAVLACLVCNRLHSMLGVRHIYYCACKCACNHRGQEGRRLRLKMAAARGA